jgi:hypothetical protein
MYVCMYVLFTYLQKVKSQCCENTTLINCDLVGQDLVKAVMLATLL